MATKSQEYKCYSSGSDKRLASVLQQTHGKSMTRTRSNMFPPSLSASCKLGISEARKGLCSSLSV